MKYDFSFYPQNIASKHKMFEKKNIMIKVKYEIFGNYDSIISKYQNNLKPYLVHYPIEFKKNPMFLFPQFTGLRNQQSVWGPRTEYKTYYSKLDWANIFFYKLLCLSCGLVKKNCVAWNFSEYVMSTLDVMLACGPIIFQSKADSFFINCAS